MATHRVLAAVAQLTSVPSVETNIGVVVDLVRRAGAAGAKVLFLPEASDFIAPASSVPDLSRPIVDGERNDFVDIVKTAAREADIYVNVCVHETPSQAESSGRCYNTNLVVSNMGDIVALYRKMHLFDVDLGPSGPTIKESNTTIPGTTLVAPVVTPIGLLGLQTCYDLRFTQESNRLAKHGAQCLTYPSAFALHTGAAHWELLLRARAVENQCYVFGSAQIGEHFPGRQSYGHAMIVDPWGSVVA
ncbi:hypothetical protein BS47DRAFT_1294493 [Hydnum rufescens UP504]|uniref:CN hydrolase domain-containing protein n=1 Tax=Hydnum rufescens UP504 TaxID=1448309 RepID=A0A9P6DU76_9AGAM|nr:hypothetical protein BS47DRAFT_1294493 [Hydnum rufescens UP504]